MDYQISNFYTNENFKSILTTKKYENNLLEVKLGENRKILKLENIDINEIGLIIWYKNEKGKIFYNNLNLIPIEIEPNKYFINAKEIIENIINEELIAGNLTLTNFKKYRTRFDFDCCYKGLIIREKYWVDRDYFEVKCYLDEVINDTRVNYISYECMFCDMINFHTILKKFLNNTYPGDLLDILNHINIFTKSIQIGDIRLFFDNYDRFNKINIYFFSIDVEVSARNIKQVIYSLLGAKTEQEVKDKFTEMEILGLL